MASCKTVVEKRIEHKTPEGRLLSVTTTRTVYFGEPPLSELESSKNRRPQPVHIRICEDVVDAKSQRSASPSIPSRPPSRATEHVGYRRYGNSTLFGDEWSTGTVVRDSHLIRSPSRSPILGADSGRLDSVLNRMNCIRIANGVQELLKDDRLARVAKQWAAQIILDNQFREREDADMNVWMGTTISESIADDWNQEMHTRRQHFFECPRLSRVGIGSQWHPRAESHIVVAVYE